MSFSFLKKHSSWFLIFSGVGFIDATYLTVKHYLGAPPTCSFLAGCDVVTTSQYATIAGIPIALPGALYYLTIFLVIMFYVIESGSEKIIKAVSYLTITGFMASLLLLYLQFFVLNAVCFYCLISAFTSTALFVVGMHYLFGNKKTNLETV